MLTQPSDDDGEIFKWCQNNVGEHDTSVFTAARTLQHCNTPGTILNIPRLGWMMTYDDCWNEPDNMRVMDLPSLTTVTR